MDAAAVDLGWVLAGALAAVLGGLEVAKKSLGYLGPLIKARLFAAKAKAKAKAKATAYTGPERRKTYCSGSPEVARQLMEQHRAIVGEVRELQQATKELAEAVRALRQSAAVADTETRTKLDFLVAAAGR